jgi:hypothetical protein
LHQHDTAIGRTSHEGSLIKCLSVSDVESRFLAQSNMMLQSSLPRTAIGLRSRLCLGSGMARCVLLCRAERLCSRCNLQHGTWPSWPDVAAGGHQVRGDRRSLWDARMSASTIKMMAVPAPSRSPFLLSRTQLSWNQLCRTQDGVEAATCTERAQL